MKILREKNGVAIIEIDGEYRVVGIDRKADMVWSIRTEDKIAHPRFCGEESRMPFTEYGVCAIADPLPNKHKANLSYHYHCR